MVSSEIVCAVILFLIFGGWFFYGWYWEKKVINKNEEFFSISKIERRILTGERKLLIVVDLLWIAFLYELFYQKYVGDRLPRTAPVIISSIIFISLNLLMLWVFSRQYKCLPVKRNLGISDMIKSVESEQFYQICDALWYSENWIRISYKFLPKNSVIGIRKRRSNGLVTIIVATVDGKEYSFYNQFSSHAIKSSGAITRLMEIVPMGKVIKDRGRHVIYELQEKKRGRDIYDLYMKSHTTMEFITDSRFVENLIEIIDK